MSHHDYLVDAVRSRTTGRLDAGTHAYVTDGGTYVLASDAHLNDDHRPQDLVAVLPVPVEGTRVLILRAAVHPELVIALRQALDPAPAEYAPENDRITLEFEDTETLRTALEYLGDTDAPVMITRGEAVIDGQAHELWDDYDEALKEH
jgi:hypothetical protein